MRPWACSSGILSCTVFHQRPLLWLSQPNLRGQPRAVCPARSAGAGAPSASVAPPQCVQARSCSQGAAPHPTISPLHANCVGHGDFGWPGHPCHGRERVCGCGSPRQGAAVRRGRRRLLLLHRPLRIDGRRAHGAGGVPSHSPARPVAAGPCGSRGGDCRQGSCCRLHSSYLRCDRCMRCRKSAERPWGLVYGAVTCCAAHRTPTFL